MTRIVFALVAAGWLVVGVAIVRARRGAPARGGLSRWHRAQDTLSRWSSDVADVADVPAAATWCRPLVVPVSPADLPRPRSGADWQPQELTRSLGL